MKRDLPQFRTVSQAELRQIWVDHPERRRLVLEIERYRRVIAQIDGLYKSTHQSWRDNVGGDLTGLHMLAKVMLDERTRLSHAVVTGPNDNGPAIS